MANSTSSSAQSAAATAPSLWLWGRTLDLTIGCAAWTIPWLALTFWLSHSAQVELGFAFALLALVCNHPHYMATLVRAFGSRDSLAAYRFYTVHLTALLGMALVAAHIYPALIAPAVTLYVTWSPWHYTGQNFGLFLLFARRAGAPPSATDRRLLLFGFAASYAVWLLTLQAQPSADPYLWSLDLPAPVIAPIAASLALCALLSGVTVLWRLRARAGWPPMLPCAVLFSTQCLWFVAPWVLAAARGQPMAPAYATTGALAFMHCAQYLWITSFYARRESPATSWRSWPYAALLGLGGVALFIPGPWIASTLLGFDLRDSTLIFIAVVNLHHFMLDGVVWKLRDRRVAAVLVGGGAVAARLGAERAALRPILRWGLAAALVAVALVSGVQQFLTREGTGDAYLDVAQRLNAHDSRVVMRRAEVLARAQQPEAALRLLDGVIAIAPQHAPAQRLYGSLLLAAGRFEHAATHYRAIEERVGLDAPGLVNAGMLWAQRGELEAAEAALRRALRLHPGLAAAHLNLAGVLLQRSAPAPALRHYEVFLASPAVARDRTYVAAGLNAASAALQVGAFDDARTLLQESAALADRLAAFDLVALAAQSREQIDRLTHVQD